VELSRGICHDARCSILYIQKVVTLISTQACSQKEHDRKSPSKAIQLHT
jgi:hypothetical protein